MSGETDRNVSTWTVDTLHSAILNRLDEADKRYEQRFAAQEKAVAAALQAQKEAVMKAEVATEKRFESVNEFRGQLSDQAATFFPRAEAESSFKAQTVDRETRFAALMEKIEVLNGQATAVASRSDVERRFGLMDDKVNAALPRVEGKLLIDNVIGRLDSVQQGLGGLNTTLASMRSNAAGEATTLAQIRDAADRRRTLTFGVLGALFTAIIVTISLYGVFHHAKVVVTPPAVTATTVPTTTH